MPPSSLNAIRRPSGDQAGGDTSRLVSASTERRPLPTSTVCRLARPEAIGGCSPSRQSSCTMAMVDPTGDQAGPPEPSPRGRRAGRAPARRGWHDEQVLVLDGGRWVLGALRVVARLAHQRPQGRRRPVTKVRSRAAAASRGAAKVSDILGSGIEDGDRVFDARVSPPGRAPRSRSNDGQVADHLPRDCTQPRKSGSPPFWNFGGQQTNHVLGRPCGAVTVLTRFPSACPRRDQRMLVVGRPLEALT